MKQSRIVIAAAAAAAGILFAAPAIATATPLAPVDIQAVTASAQSGAVDQVAYRYYKKKGVGQPGHRGNHWRGNNWRWRGHAGCWNCGGWGWRHRGWGPGYGYAYGYPYYGYPYYGYPYYWGPTIGFGIRIH